eukprot:COSAG01_NODE_31042_length_604_cov_27.580198_2_plen_130_part_00
MDSPVAMPDTRQYKWPVSIRIYIPDYRTAQQRSTALVLYYAFSQMWRTCMKNASLIVTSACTTIFISPAQSFPLFSLTGSARAHKLVITARRKGGQRPPTATQMDGHFERYHLLSLLVHTPLYPLLLSA